MTCYPGHHVNCYGVFGYLCLEIVGKLVVKDVRYSKINMKWVYFTLFSSTKVFLELFHYHLVRFFMLEAFWFIVFVVVKHWQSGVKEWSCILTYVEKDFRIIIKNILDHLIFTYSELLNFRFVVLTNACFLVIYALVLVQGRIEALNFSSPQQLLK